MSVLALHNDLILPVSQGGCFGIRNEYSRVCIGDTSLINYMLKHIMSMSNITRITCECETFISTILFQPYLNK